MAGEENIAALERELWEETGRRDLNIGPEVWTRTIIFDTKSGEVTQYERYYLIHSERFDPIPLGIDGLERDWFAGYRWWPITEIVKAQERFAPRRLGVLLNALLTDGIPDRPICINE
jgi:8-oxo-dGTP pyrophosphatase MutT (NUDIX family)